MTMNPLPPQAYTKETLGKAFAWLQAQHDSIKEFATSPDILVSLYLKAKLNGEGALDRPSIQNFKNELKSLAGMMGEFEVMEPTAATEAMIGAAATRVQMETPKAPVQAPQQAPQSQIQTAFQPTPPAPSSQMAGLDSKSKAMINEIRENFNLSADSEALRLLISAGHKALQRISKS